MSLLARTSLNVYFGLLHRRNSKLDSIRPIKGYKRVYASYLHSSGLGLHMIDPGCRTSNYYKFHNERIQRAEYAYL